jgi:hypothetical protein
VSRSRFRLATSLLTLLCACNQSTSPHATQTAPNKYAGSYSGVLLGAHVSGTVTMTVGEGSASRVAAGIGRVVAEQAENSVSATVTLASGVTFTLTGTISGNTATLTATNGSATCTFTYSQGQASGTCTDNDTGSFDADLQLVAAVQDAVLYCGTQASSAQPGVPDATVAIARLGTSVVLVVAPVTGTATSYTGNLTASGFTVSAQGTTYTGTISSDSSTMTASSGTQAWTAYHPCQNGALTFASPVTFATVAGTTTPITKNVTISSGSSTVTMGVVSLGAPVFTPVATTWLTATAVSSTPQQVSLSLVVKPASLAVGSFRAAIPVFATLATNSPDSLIVNLDITSQPPAVSGLWTVTNAGTLTLYSIGTSGLTSVLSGTSTYLSGAPWATVDQKGSLWVSDPAYGDVLSFPVAEQTSGIGAAIPLAFPFPYQTATGSPGGIAVDPQGTIWVSDTANTGYIYGFSPSDQITMAQPSDTIIVTGATIDRSPTPDPIGAVGGLASDSSGNLWVVAGDVNGVQYVLGLPKASLTTNKSYVAPTAFRLQVSTSLPTTLVFDPSGNLWIAAAAPPLQVVSGTLLGELLSAQPPAVNTTLVLVQSNGSNLSLINSITFDASGNMWLAAQSAGILDVPVSQIPALVSAGNAGGIAKATVAMALQGAAVPQAITFAAAIPSGAARVTALFTQDRHSDKHNHGQRK